MNILLRLILQLKVKNFRTISRTARSLRDTLYIVCERAAARRGAEASVWLFAKGASQIAHLCVAEPRKDLTYRATGLF